MEFNFESFRFDCLDGPNLINLRNQRMERNQQLLKGISPMISALVFEQVESRTVEELAAIKIQCLVRRFLARHRYAALLLKQYELEESKRFTKTLMQVHEGELLVQNHLLEQRIDDNAVARRNRTLRRKTSEKVLIQFRCPEDDSSKTQNEADCHQLRKIKILSLANEFVAGETGTNGSLTSTSTSKFNETGLDAQDAEDDDDTGLREPDWSALEAHLRATQMDEQEHLAYRSERDRVLADLSTAADGGYSGANVNLNRTAAVLSYDADEGNSKCNSSGRTWRNPHVNELTKPMQLCFINDMSSDEESINHDEKFKNPDLLGCDSCQHNTFEPFTCADADASCSCSCTRENEHLLHRQTILQEEARLALAQVQPMARMQLQIERQAANLRYRQDPASCAASTAFAGGQEQQLLLFTSDSPRHNENGRFSIQALQRMSLAQLQVLFNQLKSRVEDLNEDLVRLLVERDDNHTEQDAMLVDVEDLTRRAKEIAAKAQECHQVSHNDSTIIGSNELQSLDNTSSFSSAAGRTIAAAKTVVLRSAESRVAAVTSRFRPNKLMSMFASNSHLTTSI